MTSIIIGSGVKYINSQAFANCQDLTDVYCYAEKVPSTNTDAFEGSYIKYATLHVPTVSTDSYKAKKPWSDFKTFVGLDGLLPDNPNPDNPNPDNPDPDNPDPDNPDPDNPDPDNPDPNQCATPVVIISGNKVRFECRTPGAEFTSTLTTEEQFTGSEVVIGGKPITYTLTVYATAPDYSRSKPAMVKLTLSRGDVNGDGVVGIGDIVEITNIMAGKE